MGTDEASAGDSKPLGGVRTKGLLKRTAAMVDAASTETAPGSAAVGGGDGNDFSHGGPARNPEAAEIGDGGMSRDAEEGDAEATEIVDGSRSRVAQEGSDRHGDLSFFIRGPKTPEKEKLELLLKNMGGTMVSPVLCDNCPHICFQSCEVSLDNPKEECSDQTSLNKPKQECSDPTSLQACYVARQCVRRELSFGQNSDLQKEEEAIFRQNHQLFLCVEDSSSYMTMYSYAESRRDAMIVVAVTPGTGREHKSRTTAADIKGAVKAAYILVKSLHGIGYSLEGKFNAKHFIIDTAKGHINVRFAVPYGVLRRSTPMNEALDLQGFSYMIRRHIFIKAPIPHDLNYWLTLVSRNQLEGLIPFHLAVTEDQPALGVFLSLFDKLILLENTDAKEFLDIIMDLEEYKDWKDHLSNDILMETVEFINWYDKKTNYPRNAYGLLKLVRNCKNHQGQELLNVFILIVAQEYPNLMYHFQEVMFLRGHYKTRRLDQQKVPKTKTV